METRYYSEKGRPGGKHKLALHASRKVFDKITGHLDRKERLMEDLAKEAAHRKFLKDATKAMTSQWENSVENLRKKKHETRQQRLAQKADDRVEQYFKVLKWQAEEREAYNKQVKNKIFQMRGSQRDINSGILFSDCLYTNAKQIEQKNIHKLKENKEWMEFEKKMIKEDETFKEDEQVKACKKRAVAAKNQEFVKKQISEREKSKQEEKKVQIEIEKQDIEKQQKEINMIRKNAQENFLKAKRCSLNILKNSREEAEKNRQIFAKSDAELENLCAIFRDTKTQIKCEREKMRKKDIQQRLDLQKEAYQKLEEIKNQKLSNEDQIIAKAIAEIDEADAEKKRLREEYNNKLVKERNHNYENALLIEKNRKEIEREQHKWETLNRIKLMEICKSKEEESKEYKLKKIKEYKDMLDEQVKENEEIRAERRAKENAFKWNNYPEQDKMFLEYGAEMLAKQKREGKPTFPIELAIKEYKKKHHLLTYTSSDLCPKTETEKRAALKLPKITRRICPTKNDSTGVQDCFCNA